MRGHANEKTFVGPKYGLDPVRMNVGLQLCIYDFGGQQQGKFAKLRKLAFLRIADSGRGELFALTRQTKVRWNVHDDDVVGGEQERFREGFGGVLAGDRLNFFFVFLDMKQVNARQDRDPVA